MSVDEKEAPDRPDISYSHRFFWRIGEFHLVSSSRVSYVLSDGLPLPPDDSSLGTRIPVPYRENSETFTGDLAKIAHGSVSEAIAYLDRIETVIPSLAAGLQTGPDPEDFESLRELYEGLRWLSLLMDKLECGLESSLADFSPGRMRVSECQRRLTRVLKQLLCSQEEGNFVLLSDSLGGELLLLVASWKEAFNLIRKREAATQ